MVRRKSSPKNEVICCTICKTSSPQEKIYKTTKFYPGKKNVCRNCINQVKYGMKRDKTKVTCSVCGAKEWSKLHITSSYYPGKEMICHACVRKAENSTASLDYSENQDLLDFFRNTSNECYADTSKKIGFWARLRIYFSNIFLSV